MCSRFTAKVDLPGVAGDNKLMRGITAREARHLSKTATREPPFHFKILRAVEKTRTSTGCPTATSTLRVYQFRHDRTQ